MDWKNCNTNPPDRNGCYIVLVIPYECKKILHITTEYFDEDIGCWENDKSSVKLYWCEPILPNEFNMEDYELK